MWKAEGLGGVLGSCGDVLPRAFNSQEDPILAQH